MWFNGDPNWNRIRVTADQSTRIAKSVIDDQRRSLSRRLFAQDYLCEFGDAEDQAELPSATALAPLLALGRGNR